MTNQTNWTVFTNSEEQIAEIGMSVYANGFITKNESGIESNVVCSDTTHYWIIPDDPLREMKIDTEIRHVTKPGANLFLELGFAPAEAKRLQAACLGTMGKYNMRTLCNNHPRLEHTKRQLFL